MGHKDKRRTIETHNMIRLIMEKEIMPTTIMAVAVAVVVEVARGRHGISFRNLRYANPPFDRFQ